MLQQRIRYKIRIFNREENVTNYQVAEDNIDYEKDKKEDEAVAKKLTEIEEELKVIVILIYLKSYFVV